MASNTYMTNMPAVGSLEVCDPPNNSYTDDDMMALFAGGVVDLKGQTMLLPDPQTNRIKRDQLILWVNDLQTAGNIPARPMIKVGNNWEVDMNALVKQDAAFYNKLHTEYCYYEARYRYALKMFLDLVTNPTVANNTAAAALLPKVKNLNNRLNLLLEVMNYLATDRVNYVNANTEAINKLNGNINGKIAQLSKSYNMLNADDAIVTTQREAIRYTTEKNNYTTNQIAVWAALNIVAMGTIFYVYRT
jgi:hypothetical protein